MSISQTLVRNCVECCTEPAVGIGTGVPITRTRRFSCCGAFEAAVSVTVTVPPKASVTSCGETLAVTPAGSVDGSTVTWTAPVELLKRTTWIG